MHSDAQGRQGRLGYGREDAVLRAGIVRKHSRAHRTAPRSQLETYERPRRSDGGNGSRGPSDGCRRERVRRRTIERDGAGERLGNARRGRDDRGIGTVITSSPDESQGHKGGSGQEHHTRSAHLLSKNKARAYPPIVPINTDDHPGSAPSPSDRLTFEPTLRPVLQAAPGKQAARRWGGTHRESPDVQDRPHRRQCASVHAVPRLRLARFSGPRPSPASTRRPLAAASVRSPSRRSIDL